MPRPRSLTQAQVAEAALSVIDRDGLAALTMRAVARELGMSTMGLYRYVVDRDELEQLVVDLVFGGMDTAPPAPGPSWQRRIEIMVDRMRGQVAIHPAVVPLTLTHRHSSSGVLRWSEAVLGILTEAGIEGAERVIALRGLTAYIIGAIQVEHFGPLAGPGTKVIAGLPESSFPYMAETARAAGDVSADAEFSGGLAAFLRGLAIRE